MPLDGRTWEGMRQLQGDLEARLLADQAGLLSSRNFAVEQRCAPAIDLALVPLQPDVDQLLIEGGATLAAIDLASDTTPPDARLVADTPLRLEAGTNAVCDIGWEQSVHRVLDGLLAGCQIAFSDDLRRDSRPPSPGRACDGRAVAGWTRRRATAS